MGRTGGRRLDITWLGHAAFLIDGKDRILIDPLISGNELARTTPDKISCDFICITHGHGDHIGDAVSIAKRNSAKIYAIVELADYFTKNGCEAVGFNIGGSVMAGNTRITMTQAVHSSGTDAPGLEGGAGAPAGFIIESGKTVYHAGDTGLFGDMALIGSMHELDVAMVPIGGYFTMDAIQAARAVEMLRPKIAIPMHYNTWPPIKADPEEFRSEVAKRCKVQVKIPRIGDTITL